MNAYDIIMFVLTAAMLLHMIVTEVRKSRMTRTNVYQTITSYPFRIIVLHIQITLHVRTK